MIFNFFLAQNDSYCEIWLSHDDDYKQRTEVIKSDNPVWNQTFTFNYPSGKDTLKFKVIDKDLVSKDGIGSTQYDFGHLAVGQTEEVELKLKASFFDLTPNGEFFIRITKRS